MKNYTLIEPNIHESLNWDGEVIVKCLGAIIENYPAFNQNYTEYKFEVEIIPVHSQHNNRITYPALGITNDAYIDYDPDDLEEELDKWVAQLGITELIRLGDNYRGKSWHEITQ